MGYDPYCVCYDVTGCPVEAEQRPAAILPGSFNPLHFGHQRLATAARQRLGLDVPFELSLTNVDKAELSPEEMSRRIQQFVGYSPIWITRAATFVEKAQLFPGVTFVIGWDTAIRLIDPKYYEGKPKRRDEALGMLKDLGCHVLVGGRIDPAGTFREWSGGDYGGLILGLSESDFRADISSTQLRQSRQAHVSDRSSAV